MINFNSIKNLKIYKKLFLIIFTVFNIIILNLENKELIKLFIFFDILPFILFMIFIFKKVNYNKQNIYSQGYNFWYFNNKILINYLLIFFLGLSSFYFQVSGLKNFILSDFIKLFLSNVNKTNFSIIDYKKFFFAFLIMLVDIMLVFTTFLINLWILLNIINISNVKMFLKPKYFFIFIKKLFFSFVFKFIDSYNLINKIIIKTLIKLINFIFIENIFYKIVNLNTFNKWSVVPFKIKYK
ncbi:hypothetical protein STURON_00383 [Spiroplasma turonicum]|uniref:Transmembrane protein n=1 Tax=Spiroplasma turonicum TaxID=216946 RepID=A0A0K1P625_9MOLU|nr:hypothetical protein STURON_00383 [Spiroplasma turonicum]ALX70650.1 hypothetical protein STURO_v1c03820 [Spiroplasma turonicum]